MSTPLHQTPLLFPGSDLPARVLDGRLRNPSAPDMVTIDWDEAIAERAR